MTLKICSLEEIILIALLTDFYIHDIDALLLYSIYFCDEEVGGVDFIITITAQEKLQVDEKDRNNQSGLWSSSNLAIPFHPMPSMAFSTFTYKMPNVRIGHYHSDNIKLR